MSRILYAIVFVITLTGCGNNESLKDTTWIFSDNGGSSTLVFQDSTYTCTVRVDGVVDVQDGTYKHNEPILQLNMNGNILEAVIDGNKLTTKDEYPIIFVKQ